MSRVDAIATCNAASAPWHHAHPGAVQVLFVTCSLLSRNSGVASARELLTAGTMLATIPTARDSKTAKPITVKSTFTDSALGIACGAIESVTRCNPIPRAIPTSPPSTPSSTPSIADCQKSRSGCAPSADRRASSR